MKVGYGRVVITPQEPMPLAGYGDTVHRMHERVLDDICTTCVALTDKQEQTLLLIGNDLIYIPEYAIEQIRPVVHAKTGVPYDRIMLAATHTHSAPDLTDAKEEACVKRYVLFLAERAAEAAQLAMEDRKPARMLVGDVETEGLNFVRHYYGEDIETGEKVVMGDNFNDGATKRAVAHVTDADPTMHLVKFEREGGKDVVIANWRAHGTVTGGYSKKDLSSDYIGPFREVLEAQQDCHVLYLQGACGNINPKSRIEGETYTEDHRVLGARLAYFAVKGLESMRPAAGEEIQTKQVIFDCPINHDLDHIAEITAGMTARWDATHDFNYAMEPGRPYGIRNLYHAFAVTKRSKMDPTMPLELNAIAIGDDLAIVTAPDELFDTNTMFVEEHAPYQKVLTMGYSNGRRGYIPAIHTFEHTSYETDCCECAPGSAEKIADTFVGMLEELKGN